MTSQSIRDITGHRQCYVSYSALQAAPVTLRLGGAVVTLVLTAPDCCLVTVPSKFAIYDADTPKDRALCASVRPGSAFLMSYHDDECEVRLGHRFLVIDR